MENKNIVIERIDITAFGGLSAVSLNLTEGINLLECPNESGKSTVAAFVKFVLYGFRGKGHSVTDNAKKMYLPWSGNPAAGSVTLNVGGRRIRVERQAASSDKVACTDLQSGAKLYDGLCPGEEIFGVGAELFEKSAFFSNLNRPEGKDESLAKLLQGLFTTSDSADEAGDAVKLLTKQKNALQGRAGAGEIPTLEKQLVQLTSRLERELDGMQERRELEEELETMTKTAAAREADMERLGEERRNAENYEAVLLLEEYQSLVDARDAAANQATAAAENAPTEDDIKDIKELKKENDRLAAAVEAEETAAKAAAKSKSKTGNLFLLGTALFGFASGFLFGVELMIYAAIALVLAVAFCVLSVITKAKAKEAVAPQSKESYEKSKAALDSALKAFGGDADSYEDSVDAMTKKLLEAERQRLVLKEKENSLQSFLQRNDVEELRLRADGATKPERDRNKIEFEYQFALKSAMGLRQKESEKKSRLAVLTADGADVSVTETELLAATEALRKAKLRYNALCLAIEGLNDSENELRGNVVPRLAELTAKLFARMTGGKYDGLELDNKLFMSFESEYGMKSAEHLSAGTREGLYLCMRLALLRLMYGEAKTPVLLDDAFSKQDDTRLESMMKLLSEEGKQFMIFCCTDRERKTLDSLGKEYNTLSI